MAASPMAVASRIHHRLASSAVSPAGCSSSSCTRGFESARAWPPRARSARTRSLGEPSASMYSAASASSTAEPSSSARSASGLLRAPAGVARAPRRTSPGVGEPRDHRHQRGAECAAATAATAPPAGVGLAAATASDHSWTELLTRLRSVSSISSSRRPIHPSQRPRARHHHPRRLHQPRVNRRIAGDNAGMLDPIRRSLEVGHEPPGLAHRAASPPRCPRPRAAAPRIHRTGRRPRPPGRAPRRPAAGCRSSRRDPGELALVLARGARVLEGKPGADQRELRDLDRRDRQPPVAQPSAAAARRRVELVWPARGSTTPASSTPSTAAAMDTAYAGNPCRKLVVPSSGSTIHTRPSRHQLRAQLLAHDAAPRLARPAGHRRSSVRRSGPPR